MRLCTGGDRQIGTGDSHAADSIRVVFHGLCRLDAADRPLRRVFAQHGTGMHREILRQRLVGILRQDRVGVVALARREEDVETELTLLADVEAALEDSLKNWKPE